jgi:3'-phosphoadenosine 5'-phosphosulfate sulfotransferase (PAPS reductase)/FAD synthetase
VFFRRKNIVKILKEFYSLISRKSFIIFSFGVNSTVTVLMSESTTFDRQLVVNPATAAFVKISSSFRVQPRTRKRDGRSVTDVTRRSSVDEVPQYLLNVKALSLG